MSNKFTVPLYCHDCVYFRASWNGCKMQREHGDSSQWSCACDDFEPVDERVALMQEALDASRKLERVTQAIKSARRFAEALDIKEGVQYADYLLKELSGEARKKVVYVAHPLVSRRTGNEIKDLEETWARVDRVAMICRAIRDEEPDIFIFSPIHAFGFYNIFEREKPLEDCKYALENFADELWVYGDWESSEGCKLEIEWAKDKGIPVLFKALPFDDLAAGKGEITDDDC